MIMQKRNVKNLLLSVLIIGALVVMTGCSNDDAESSDGGFTSVEELREARIAGVNAPIVHTVMETEFPNADTSHFNENMDMVAALLSGQIDGFMVSYPTAFLIERNNPELMVLAEPLSAHQAGIGVRPEETELLEEINTLIANLEADGTLAEMVDRWYSRETRHTELPEIEVPTEGNPIRVGVAENLEPASFLDANGELTGFDIELTRRLANHLDRPIEFVPLLMAAYASSVEAGQVDMVISNWIINPNLTGIEFSNPYFDTPFMMVVRRGE